MNAASYTEDEHEAGLAAKDIYFSGIAKEDNWEQDKANKAYKRQKHERKASASELGTSEEGRSE